MTNQIKPIGENRLAELEIVSRQVGGMYSAEQVGVIQKNVAKNTTLAELAYFLNVCKSMELNPFNKEVWCYKDGRDNLLIFSGRDGFLAKAQKHPLFNGIRSSEVCEKDNFSIDIFSGNVTHSHNGKDRGAIIGAYAVVFRKGGEPTIEYAEFSRYNKGRNTWSTNPDEMIKKVAESHALKKAFGISGIKSEYDWEVKNGVASPNVEVMTKEEIIIQKEIKKISDFILNATTIEQLEEAEPFVDDNGLRESYELKKQELCK
jgi:phage recombination protein Bet